MERDKEISDFFRTWTLWAFLGCALLCGPVALWDEGVFRLINGLHSPVSDAMWLGFTTLGDGLVLAIIAGVFIPSKPRATALAIILLMLSSFVVHPVKWIVGTPRPVSALESVHAVGPRLRSNSFPSGHSAAAMTTALGIGHYCRNPWIAGVALGAAALVGLSRVGVGAHFPADVLGGFLIALTLYWGARRFLVSRLERRFPEAAPFTSKWIRCAFLVELAAAACVFLVYSGAYAESPAVACCAAFFSLVAVVWGVGAKEPSMPSGTART